MTTEKTIITLPGGASGPEETQDACLVQIYGETLGKRFPIEDELTIGRSDANTIMVQVPNASRRHARIFLDEGRCWIEDLGSTNGTHVNDVEIARPRPLANGDLITTGGTVFKFIVGGNVEALYYEEIYRLTILDGLTGVHNKRYFDEFLEREFARAQRHGRPLSVALIDLDRFKDVNDSFGHLAGDSVLKMVARLIQSRVRQEELLARYGGEEFVVVLPETDLAGARAFAEKVRQEVEAATAVVDGETIGVTISIGIGTLEAGREGEDLVREADRQLYRAKAAGRNTVMPADEHRPTR